MSGCLSSFCKVIVRCFSCCFCDCLCCECNCIIFPAPNSFYLPEDTSVQDYPVNISYRTCVVVALFWFRMAKAFLMLKCLVWRANNQKNVVFIFISVEVFASLKINALISKYAKMLHTDDMLYLAHCTYTVHIWRTSLENGAQKFGLCAIGAQPQNPRIIPVHGVMSILKLVFDTVHEYTSHNA